MIPYRDMTQQQDPNAGTDWFTANAPQPSMATATNNGNTGVTGGLPTGDGSGLSGGMPQAGGDWIANALAAAGSTDDPNYWRQVITQHGDMNNPSAQAYWVDRINRGDGAAGVRNGTVQKFQDSGGGSTSGYGGLLSPYGQYSTPAPFTAPTVTDQNAPGYQWAKEQGMKGIEQSAAARGGLLTGGTLKALDTYNTGLANQTYGDVFNRALQGYQTNANTGLQGYQTNRDTFYSNQNNPWSKLFQSMSLGQNSSTAGATGA